MVLDAAEFWELGHKLFKTTPESFPVPFVPGDAFNPEHLAVVPPIATVAEAPPPLPLPLTGLTSLNPLRGRVSAIHASAFFHLFDEEKQMYLARALAGLLSPEPGSVILGTHGGRPEKGFRDEQTYHSSHVRIMFCHSPESWADMWENEIFEKGQVKVEASLIEHKREDVVVKPGYKLWLLVWSVTRL